MSETPQRTIPIHVDTGTAYNKRAATSNLEMAQVGRGTPMGELLRRYPPDQIMIRIGKESLVEHDDETATPHLG